MTMKIASTIEALGYVLKDHIDFLNIGNARFKKMEDIDLCDIERSIEKLRDYRPHDAEKINKLQDTL